MQIYVETIKKVQKYLSDSSDYWRGNNNLSQTETEHWFEERYSTTSITDKIESTVYDATDLIGSTTAIN